MVTFCGMEAVRRFCRTICRTKILKFENLRFRNVPRFKGLLHLLIQGVGSGTALGIYVFIAAAAKNHAGPSVVLSVLGMAVVSWITGSCYSELACRIPVMGSSYLYSYAIFGEIIAFILGWSLVIESVITIALAAVTLSNHLDVLSGGRLQAWIKRDLGVYPWDGDSSPEILAAGIILFVAMMAVCRSKNVALTIHSCLFVLHMLVIIAVTFLLMFHVDSKNWGTNEAFFHTGSSGIISASALLMSSLTGIKSIAMASEETRKPSRNIPITHTLSLMIIVIALFVISALITLSIPVDQLSSRAPILTMFEVQLGVKNSKYFVGVGCICGFLLTLIAQMDYTERLLFSMARDQLIFRNFSRWNSRSNTPWECRIGVATLSAIIALLISYELLLQLISTGVLISFAATCLATIIARYDPCQIGLAEGNPLRKTVSAESFIISRASSQISDATTSSKVSEENIRLKEVQILLTAEKGTSTRYSMDATPEAQTSPEESISLPDLDTYRRVTKALWVSVGASILLGVILRFGKGVSEQYEWIPVTFSLTCVFLNICCSLFIFRAPVNNMPLVYSAGGMPFLQMLAIVCLTVMMFHLPAQAWIRWIVCASIGTTLFGEVIPLSQLIFHRSERYSFSSTSRNKPASTFPQFSELAGQLIENSNSLLSVEISF